MRVRQIKARACARMGQRVARNFWASMRVVNLDYAGLAAEEAANIEFADGLEGLLGTTDAAAAELDNYLKERGYEF